MTIKRISKEAFFGTYVKRAHPPRCAEVQALCDLPIPGGMQMPCRWKHSGRGTCHGASFMGHAAKTNGFALILDERSLLFGQTAYDVTDEVLKALNSRYAGKAAAR